MDFLGFPPLMRLERVEARQRSTSFSVTRQAPEEVRGLCREVAADLGLVVVEDDPSRLRLRDPFLLRVFPVEVVVGIQGEYGGVEVKVTGYSGAGGSIAQPRYVDRLITVFAERVQRGGRSSEAAFEKPEGRRARRMMLSYLRLIQWIPLALLIPVAIAAQAYLDGLKQVALLVAWCYVVVEVPLVASFFRRRLTGIGSLGDLLALVAVDGVFVVGVVLWLVFALS
jgi:hypothetical protein